MRTHEPRHGGTADDLALADVLAAGCGGVATVPARTPDEDVARLVALGCAVVRSGWVQVAMWEAGA